MAKPELTSLLRQALDVLDKEKASSNDGEASSSTDTFPSSILPTPNVFGLNATPTRAHHAVQGKWVPKSKMVPLGMDKTTDKIKMMEGCTCTSSIHKAIQTAFNHAMNHLSRVQDDPIFDLSDVD